VNTTEPSLPKNAKLAGESSSQTGESALSTDVSVHPPVTAAKTDKAPFQKTIFVDTQLPEESLTAKSKNTFPSLSNPSTAEAKESLLQSHRKRLRSWRPAVWSAAILVASFIVLIAIGRTAFDNFNQEQILSENARTTQQTLTQLQSLVSNLHESESGARGFAISGKQSHLDQYYGALKTIPTQVNEIRKLLSGDSLGLHQLRGIEASVNEHLSVMKQMIDLGNKNVFRAVGQRTLTDQGYDVTKKLSDALQALTEHEQEQLATQTAAAHQCGTVARAAIVAGAVAACAAILLFGSGMYWLLGDYGKIEEKLDGFLESTPDAILIVNKEGKIVVSNSHAERLLGYTPQELTGQTVAILVPERYRRVQMQQYAVYFSNRVDQSIATTVELCAVHKDGREFPIEMSMKPLETKNGLLVTSAIRDISQRKATEDKITRLNEELEQRAAELEASNKELEAFSYSVSHDLRSPLQNIDGFSQALLEDYSDRLDTEGQNYLNHVRSSCHHMGEIIDGLLGLSKMMRTDMCRQTVDISAMARQIADELKQKSAERSVDFLIAEKLTCDGDSQLLRVLLENLLNNAWKFTSKQPRARIEVGSMPQSNGEQVFYVRDDGAGFDAEHASNLFAPFKRLHKATEFEGTGIGLATAHRVVARHGGKIWAAGAVGHGATFCFTLSPPNKENAVQNQ